MDPTKLTEWSLADDMQSFEYTFQQLIDLWPQKAMISGVITAACAFFYADAVLLWLWVWTILGDFFLGLYASLKTGTFSLRKLRHGACKIVSYSSYLLVAAVAGVAMTRATGIDFHFLNLVIAYFILTELSSILRHFSELGFKDVPVLRRVILKFGKKAEAAVDKLGGGDAQGPKDPTK